MGRKALAAGLLAGAALVVMFITGDDSLCFFKRVYGMPCPGCGLTRAFVRFLEGDITGAFYYHPVFPLAALAGTVMLLRNLRPFSLIYDSRYFWLTLVIAFTGQWVIRMMLFFPDTPPMDLNREALMLKALRFLLGLQP
jgi:hypothetical protein